MPHTKTISAVEIARVMNLIKDEEVKAIVDLAIKTPELLKVAIQFKNTASPLRSVYAHGVTKQNLTQHNKKLASSALNFLLTIVEGFEIPFDLQPLDSALGERKSKEGVIYVQTDGLYHTGIVGYNFKNNYYKLYVFLRQLKGGEQQVVVYPHIFDPLLQKLISLAGHWAVF